MKYIKITITILCCALTAACTSIPLSTMWKMRNFDPLQADPSAIKIAVITDKIVQLKDDAVTLELSFKSDFPEHTFENVSKATVETNSLVPELNELVGENQEITLFYLDEETAHKMRLSQNRIRIIRENEIEGQGSFGISVNTGCFEGPKPKELKADVYAQLEPENGYIKMISDVDLLGQVNEEKFWNECETAKDGSKL